MMALKLFMLFCLCCDNVLGLGDGVIAMVNNGDIELWKQHCNGRALFLLWFTHIEVCFALFEESHFTSSNVDAHQLFLRIISLRMPYRRVLGWSLLPLLLTMGGSWSCFSADI